MSAVTSDDDKAQPRPAPRLAPRCVSIDLEVGRHDQRIHQFAAVRGDSDQVCVFGKGDLQRALQELDRLADGAAFVLGHNLVAFDLPHLAAAQPGLGLLALPAVDTLRLNPLAFPRNPYHHQVKHYQDGQLRRGRINNPELDARLALELFRDQHAALQAADRASPDLLCAWHWLTTFDQQVSGLDAFFSSLRGKPRPDQRTASAALTRLLQGRGCRTAIAELLDSARSDEHATAQQPGGASMADPWALAYALAWLSVAGGNSVMPPWVRHQFPQAGRLVRRLRDTACNDPDCDWCRDQHSARAQLERWFGAGMAFRPAPLDKVSGRPLQEVIVESAMRGEHVLGILPTGTGKSLCYQLPALSRFEKTGALTVVISPLVALMADQVAGMEARGHSSCAAFNGLLSMPERSDVLDRLRLGDIGILITSPEQLRSRSLVRALAQREIGAWVLDEAHCLSKWGHDFRPDYRYVGKFIGKRAGDEPPPPILCLTATAKPEVVADIIGHFQHTLGVELRLCDGGANRDNLAFDVIPTTSSMKFEHVHQVLEHYLPADQAGGAIVYCATRRQTEEVAEFLRVKEVAADYFHAGLPPDSKKSVQERFIRGEIRVIGATNAFGMGIDKPDVRLVIHADIPGSLENYLQEAGRAGRDRQQARCVLLYVPDDVERQFSMSARSRLSQRDIQSILRALRQIDRKKRLGGEVVATAGEILAEDDDGGFVRDATNEDTRVKTAIAWLEEAELVTRSENRVQMFPSSLRIGSIDEARARLARQPMSDAYQRQMLRLVESLIGADADDGLSTDELMLASGMNPEQLRQALFDLERLGIASNDAAITAFVHAGVARASTERLDAAAALESALIDLMREEAPDLAKGEESPLHLRLVSDRLKRDGHPVALQDKLLRLLRSISADGRSEDAGVGSIVLRKLDAETVSVRLQREWSAIAELAERRRSGARLLLAHLLGTLPAGSRGTDLLAETTLGKLLAALESDLVLAAQTRDRHKLLDRSLLWLHEQEVIRLNKGLAVFRPAMTIRLGEERRGFARVDFEPLRQHYREQAVQIHVMAEYAQRGLQAIAEALRLASDYFTLCSEAFIEKWLPAQDKALQRQTTPASWKRIVEDLGNPVQQRIVADDREQTNVLVLAGPGSGKTRVLVHRIGYLVRVRRERPEGILALAYNHHAAVDIRRRLRALIGDDARGVTVLTCHAMAMRLTGTSLAGKRHKLDDDGFRDIVEQAVELLEGRGLPPDEADAQRDRLLGGFRWILVDEYQDIGAEQYRLIAAIAGRSRQDEDSRLSLFAVGDDDQNIYAFNGASVEFIRRFEADYRSKPSWLVENYRSTAHIIDAANRVIAPARQRLKLDHPIVIDRRRRRQPAGGAWSARDPVGHGRVQLIPAGPDAATQALAALAELQRLAALDPHWDRSRAAVIAREWRSLDPLRSACELAGIPVQSANEDSVPFWRLRETQALVDWLRAPDNKLIAASAALDWLQSRPTNPWWTLLQESVAAYRDDTEDASMPAASLIDWLAESGRDARRKQRGLLLLTAHRAKGLEFDHVVVLDGGWDHRGANEDADAPRRLYYVAMTRAIETLTLMQGDRPGPFLRAVAETASALQRPPTILPPPPAELQRVHRRLTQADIDLGFAGRSSNPATHHAIAALQPGDPLRLERQGEAWTLLDAQGCAVGRLAKAFSLPDAVAVESVRVVAVVVRRRDETLPEYLGAVRHERWETVLPEIVWVPGG
jgi:ATP-dependent DNA helicase RecQ